MRIVRARSFVRADPHFVSGLPLDVCASGYADSPRPIFCEGGHSGFDIQTSDFRSNLLLRTTSTFCIRCSMFFGSIAEKRMRNIEPQNNEYRTVEVELQKGVGHHQAGTKHMIGAMMQPLLAGSWLWPGGVMPKVSYVDQSHDKQSVNGAFSFLFTFHFLLLLFALAYDVNPLSHSSHLSGSLGDQKSLRKW